MIGRREQLMARDIRLGGQSFNFPYRVFADGAGSIFVAEVSNCRVSKWRE